MSIRTSLARLRCVAIFAVCLYSRSLIAQTTRTPQLPSLRGFFEALVNQYDPKKLPNLDDVMGITDQVAGMSPHGIADALPAILIALKHQDNTIEGYAATALFSIGLRPDGATLLEPHSRSIAGGLDLPDVHIQGATVQILSMLGPKSRYELEPLLVSFVRRTDRDLIAQTDAFSLLLRIAPENPDVVSALQNFASRPLDERSKDALINGIANSHTESIIAADVLIAALEDTSEGVRFQAAQGIRRMPKEMIRRAKPALRKLMQQPDEAPDVKNAAKEALQQLQ